MRWVDALLDLLFPRKCIFCGKILCGDQRDYCDNCLRNISVFHAADKDIPGIARWTALWHYEEPVRGALLNYKFNGKQHHGIFFGQMLAEKISREFSGCYDLITYVPVSFRRKLKRGYDQVFILANSAGEVLGKKPVATLKKIRHNRAQSSLEDAALRKKNVRGAYRVRDAKLITGKRILLIDDIITTGSTVSECARMLLASGAEEVLSIAVAAGRGRNG